MGGSGDGHGDAIARDGAGNLYVVGWTTSLDFPQAGQPQAANGGAERPEIEIIIPNRLLL